MNLEHAFACRKRTDAHLPLRAAVIVAAVHFLATCAVDAAPPTSFEPRGISGGGAVFAPSFSPHAPGEMHVGCDMGGLYRTTNNGASWTMHDCQEIVGNRGAVVQYTNDPQVMYCIDFTSIMGGDTRRPSKSIDGGATWTPLAGDPTGQEAYFLFADPNNSQRLFVTDYSALYFSSNGGASFTQRFSTGSGNGLWVGGAFFDGDNIYVGTNQGVLASFDGGGSFSVAALTGIPAGQSIFSFAGAREGGTGRVFCVTLDSGDVFPGMFIEGSFTGYGGVYSIDVGQTAWTLRTTGIPGTAYPSHVAMARNEVDIAYLAGSNSSGNPTVYRTTNGGANWSSVFTTASNGNVQTGYCGASGPFGWTWAEVAMAFAVHPTDANRAMFTDFGFAHATSDGGATWQALYVPPAHRNPAGSGTPTGASYGNNGLDVTAAWWLSWVPSTQVMLGGYTDIRSTRSTDGGATWGFGFTGLTQNTTYMTARQASTGRIFAATSSIHDLYQSTYLTDARIDGGTGRVSYSDDNGASWSVLHDFGRPVIWFALDPTDPNRAYASVVHSTAGGVYTTANLGAGAASIWTVTTAPPRTQGHPYNLHVLNDGTLVATFSGRRAGAPLNFTASSGVFISTNNGASWTDRSHTDMQWWTKDLVIDPNDASQNTWYACVFNGWGGTANNRGGVWRTTNRGVNWTRISPTVSVESCVVRPGFPNEMYYSTELDGLWYTENLSSPTPTFSRVNSYPFFHPVRMFFNPSNANEMWVTSFGNGIRVGTFNASVEDWGLHGR